MSADPAVAIVASKLAPYVTARRWFRGKARTIARVSLEDTIPLPGEGDTRVWLGIVAIEYTAGEAEQYALPLAIVDPARADLLRRARPHFVVMDLDGGGAIIDALGDERVLRRLLGLIAEERTLEHGPNRLVFRHIGKMDHEDAAPRIIDAEQSNTSIVFGDAFILKLVRKIDAGASPDIEMGEFLTCAGYAHSPAVAGAIELTRARVSAEPATLAILHRFVPNRGDAWSFFLERLAGRLDGEGPDVLGDDRSLLRVLAERVASMHVALGSRADLPAFAPEAIAKSERAELAKAVRESLHAALGGLDGRALAGDAAACLGSLTARKSELEAVLDRFGASDVVAQKIRVHGDLHLGQILVSGADFMLIDFEGEPARPLVERKAKRSPLVDVAGVLRSLHYATMTAARAKGTPRANARATAWQMHGEAAFIEAYAAKTRGAAFLPARAEDMRALLDFYVLEKCVYEVHYEMNNRPDWITIPLAGLTDLTRRLGARDAES